MDKGIKITFFLDEVIFFLILDQLNLSNIKSFNI